MKKSFIFPIILFITAFLPRAIYPVARSHVWHDRSIVFLEALQTGDLAATVQSSHPGIMTMWLVAAARWFGQTFLPETYNTGYWQQSSLEIIFLALVISLLIVLTFLLLRRLFPPLAAIVATLLLALDPFHISISKTIHVDALMSMFLLVSCLYVLLFIRQQEPLNQRPLLLSGFFGGLALLTKTPALFAFPFLLLGLLVWQANHLLTETSTWPPRQQLWQSGLKIARYTAIWLGVLLLTFVLFNPALWVDPAGAMQTIVGGTTTYVQTPHENPILFQGIIYADDPGLLYYPVNILLKSTAAVTLAFVFSLPTLFLPQIERPQKQTLWLLLAYALFFAIQMSLAEKKADRYVLPSLQGIILFAGIGTTLLLHWLFAARQPLRWAFIALIVLGHTAVSLPRHPYYGTHFNRLLGTPKSILASELVAGQEQGEGLDLAADYLNSLPNAVLTSASVQITESFNYFYVGKTVEMTDDASDYLVFARNWVVRGMQLPTWQETWLAYKDRPPKHVVSFDGVPYVWIYKSGPQITEASVEHWLPAQLGNEIRFLGYSFVPKTAVPGEPVTITLYWESSQKTAADYTIFIHLLNEEGELIAQRDSQPQNGIYPTYLWDEGERVQDKFELMIPEDAPEGTYSWAIGMYELATLTRLPVASDQAVTIEDNRLLLPGPTIVKENESN